MHSAILQNLDFSMDAGTDGGRLRASGQFMTGYKPVIEANTVTADTSASDYDKGLFDCTTTTFAGAAFAQLDHFHFQYQIQLIESVFKDHQARQMAM